MANIVKVLSTFFDKLNRREIKVLRYGKSDVQTALETSPYGIDSNPIEGMMAIYAETNEKGKTVIVGYLNKNQLSESGEIRLYSTDDQGELKTYLWLKKDGNIELGGNSDNLVRYSPLDSALKNLALSINQQLTLIASGITTAGGAYTPQQIDIDIADAKIDEIKTL
jgi:hypothetical protein